MIKLDGDSEGPLPTIKPITSFITFITLSVPGICRSTSESFGVSITRWVIGVLINDKLYH